MGQLFRCNLRQSSGFATVNVRGDPEIIYELKLELPRAPKLYRLRLELFHEENPLCPLCLVESNRSNEFCISAALTFQLDIITHSVVAGNVN